MMLWRPDERDPAFKAAHRYVEQIHGMSSRIDAFWAGVAWERERRAIEDDLADRQGVIIKQHKDISTSGG